MRILRTLRVLLPALALGLISGPGCDGGQPATGTQASPVNKEEAAKQNQAIQDATKAMMKSARKK